MSRLACPLMACTLAVSAVLVGPVAAAEGPRQFGFGKTDVTPDRPMRLSGYGSRARPFEGIGEKLFCRAMALRQGDELAVLASVDTIGFPGSLTDEIAADVQKRHGVPRERFVLCFTHSHTAPHVSAGLTNIFTEPLSETEAANARHYAKQLREKVVAAVDQAIKALAPGRLYFAEGRVTFAQNRRVLKNGRWTGFGVDPDGVVDHSLPLLIVADDEKPEDGIETEKIRGLVFNYACHCTTFGPQYNRVNGDWAGYAAADLEGRYPDAVALCTIGCGADANPPRDNDPEKALGLSQAHGRMIALEVARLLKTELHPITEPLKASYGFAGLPVDRPSVAELKERLKSGQAQVRRHAEQMLAIHERMGQLPETYPAPVQTWRFGDELTMVFLGGEVVADYSLRLKREIEADHEWITAYANDVFGYVASERVRREGGYEVDRSMILYNQPGPWAEGTEEVLIRRVHELLKSTGTDRPLEPEEALNSFRLPEGFAIDIVAAEPLIADPVSFAVAADGRLWVVEMGDYPRGQDGSGEAGGRVKVLTDRDGDGRYDEAETFLDGLPFPTGVLPWRDGALVSAAPDIFYAEDTDGDGRADRREVLFTGFVLANPQHRVNGFAYGLDNWIYLASGASNGNITCVKTGETVNIAGRDVRIRPDEGKLEPVSGRSQYGRCRDDFGEWFGNTNSQPLFHFVIEDRDLRRNPYVAAPSAQAHLMTPATAPPVYPTSRTADRFNDLHAADRFTSACSPHVFRDVTLGEDVAGAVFVCEPVHNLVHRSVLRPHGATFQAERLPAETQAEFLSSTDPWHRPVRAVTGPDGALWVADMYRHVIEHPQWIPEAWQERLDLRAGSDRGRIYRVYRTDNPPRAVPNLAALSSTDLVERLTQSNGWERDTAQQLLVERRDASPPIIERLRELATSADSPATRAQALGTLDGLGRLDADVLTTALDADDPRVLRFALELAGPLLNGLDGSNGSNGSNGLKKLRRAAVRLVDHDSMRVRCQLAVTLGECRHPEAADALTRLAVRDAGDQWMRTAVLSSARPHAAGMIRRLLATTAEDAPARGLLADLIATALGDDPRSGAREIVKQITTTGDEPIASWRLSALASVLDALRRRNVALASLDGDASTDSAIGPQVEALLRTAREWATAADRKLEDRIAAVRLLGRTASTDADLDRLQGLLTPQCPPALQTAVVDALAETRRDDVPRRLLEPWRQLAPAVRSQILESLLTRSEWTAGLLDAVEQESVAAGSLSPATRQRLLTHADKAIRSRAQKLLETGGQSGRAEVLQQYRHVAELDGDAIRGRELFRKHCAACHRHDGHGNDHGPKLAALEDRSADALLTAILDPNRAVEQKYQGYTIATTDGRTLAGLILAETATSLTLAHPDGRQETVLRIDIAALVGNGKSAMPEGFERDLRPQDLADMIRFIQAESMNDD